MGWDHSQCIGTQMLQDTLVAASHLRPWTLSLIQRPSLHPGANTCVHTWGVSTEAARTCFGTNLRHTLEHIRGLSESFALIVQRCVAASVMQCRPTVSGEAL
jgi:hypothetical protein